LKGGVVYHDGQFDDARLALNIAQTAAEKGAVLLNYFKVTSLRKAGDGKINGVTATDLETGETFDLHAKTVINATGVFADEVLQMDKPGARPTIRPSQGVHIVLDAAFLSGTSALMIPKTADGRVLFAVPWHGKVLVGTTDTPLNNHSLEPQALEAEVNFILETAGSYLQKAPTRSDVLSVYAGLRPLAAPDKDTDSTKEISRSHKIITAASGLITITGGKWTTFRKMAEDTVDAAIVTGGLAAVACATEGLHIHGYTTAPALSAPLDVYGSDAELISALIKAQPALGEQLHPRLPYIKAQVIWAVQQEMARTVDDVLSRRLRALMLDARAAINMAPAVANLMAAELGKDKIWEEEQVKTFTAIAGHYLLH
jgi:glycerol-3-phosphate dehydrogenase